MKNGKRKKNIFLTSTIVAQAGFQPARPITGQQSLNLS